MSDLSAAEHQQTHINLAITHVLSVMPGSVLLPSSNQRTLQIPIRDLPFEELAAHLGDTTAFIADALAQPKANVLVHCVQGRSRSASVISAYLMATRGMSVNESLDFIKTKRDDATPNGGFISQLHEYRGTLGSRVAAQ